MLKALFITSVYLCVGDVVNALFTAAFSNNAIASIGRSKDIRIKHPITLDMLRRNRNNYGPLGKTQRELLSAKNTEEDHLPLLPQEEKKPFRKRELPQSAVKIYVDYLLRLWGETSPDERRHIAQDKARDAVKTVQHLMQGEEYTARKLLSKKDKQAVEAREYMMEACRLLLASMENKSMDSNLTETQFVEKEASMDFSVSSKSYLESLSRVSRREYESEVLTSDNNHNVTNKSKKKKKSRSVLFGATMGAVAACWVFSGNYIFTGVFTLMTILGQLEYYRMVMNAGIYPARRISVLGACSMFITALFAPNLHQLCLPFMTTAAMMWFLMMRQRVTNISEIATTVTGMLYLGYIPSFWVRLRLLGAAREKTRLAPLVAPILSFLGTNASRFPQFIPNSIHLPITTGAVFIFWSWLCIAFSDVAAYFAGRRFGKTKLAVISPAAGATSPNKTVEGLIGGCIISGLLAVFGAWVQKWPWWWITGPLHGISLAFLGLIGDLTASMLKRDAGLKDFGDLIPDHGGIMDRVDSFIFTAPYAYFVCAYVIPKLKNWSIL